MNTSVGRARLVFQLLALVVAGICSSAASAACPVAAPIAMCSSAGMSILSATGNSWPADRTRGTGGSFWLAGAGDPAIGAGNDSGAMGRRVLDPTPFADGSWMYDFISGDGGSGERCFIWDAGSAGADGCLGALPSTPLQPSDVVVTVVSDTSGNAVVFSSVGHTGLLDWDFILIDGGGTTPFQANGFGVVGGMPMQRAVHIAGGGVRDGMVQVSVFPLSYIYFDELGGTRFADPSSLNADLYGYVGGVWTALGKGPAGGVVSIDPDTFLCWGFTTGEFIPTLGDGVLTADLGVTCVQVGGATPSQNVDRATFRRDRGAMTFEWHVTAQLDIVGFQIVSVHPTKDRERALNSTPIFRGQNDATDETYVVSFPRSVVRRPGLYELRMQRQDGSVTTTTFLRE